jgi:hypothetical protein
MVAESGLQSQQSCTVKQMHADPVQLGQGAPEKISVTPAKPPV